MPCVFMIMCESVLIKIGINHCQLVRFEAYILIIEIYDAYILRKRLRCVVLS